MKTGLGYVKLAVSKDKLRKQLTDIYRDHDHWVATDGHRLHYVDALNTEDTGFLNLKFEGEENPPQFPRWQDLLPSGWDLGVKLYVSKDDIKLLRSLNTIAKQRDQFAGFFMGGFKGGQATYMWNDQVESTFAHTLFASYPDYKHERDWITSFNLRYFYDAIQCVDGRHIDLMLQPNILSAVKLSCADHHALIMPLDREGHEATPYERSRELDRLTDLFNRDENIQKSA